MPERARIYLEVTRPTYHQVLDRVLEFDDIVRACVSSRPSRRGRTIRISVDARGPSREYLANLAIEMRRTLPVESMTISIGTQYSSNRGWSRLDIPRSPEFRIAFDQRVRTWVPEEPELFRSLHQEFFDWTRHQRALSAPQEAFEAESERIPPQVLGEITLDLMSRVLSVLPGSS